MNETVTCPSCGASRPKPKQWHKLPPWKRERRKCGICARTRHGMSRTRLHKEWGSMKARCGLYGKWVSNPSAQKYYVDKGITVCAEWVDDFKAFAAWALSNGYTDTMTLDRIDSDKGYSPDNCRWISMAENLRARKDRKLDHERASQVRALATGGWKYSDIAAAFGISEMHVWKIGHGQRWSEAVK